METLDLEFSREPRLIPLNNAAVYRSPGNCNLSDRKRKLRRSESENLKTSERNGVFGGGSRGELREKKPIDIWLSSPSVVGLFRTLKIFFVLSIFFWGGGGTSCGCMHFF